LLRCRCDYFFSAGGAAGDSAAGFSAGVLAGAAAGGTAGAAAGGAEVEAVDEPLVAGAAVAPVGADVVPDGVLFDSALPDIPPFVSPALGEGSIGPDCDEFVESGVLPSASPRCLAQNKASKQTPIQIEAVTIVMRVNTSPAFAPKALEPPAPPSAPANPPPRPRCTSTSNTKKIAKIDNTSAKTALIILCTLRRSIGRDEARQGDKERGRQGANPILRFSLSPCLQISLSHFDRNASYY
jgi:hypothetical protein